MGYDTKEEASKKLHGDRVKKSDEDAEAATKKTNAAFETTSAKLDAKYAAAKNPYVDATNLDQAAKIAADNSQAALTAALSTQKTEVGEATTIHEEVVTEADALRVSRIDSAMASAVIYEESGSADHTRHTEAKEVECNAERAMLKDERDTIKLARTAIG